MSIWRIYKMLNGIAQALKEIGFGEGKQAIARWRSAEVEVLNQICREHNIERLHRKIFEDIEVTEYRSDKKTDLLKKSKKKFNEIKQNLNDTLKNNISIIKHTDDINKLREQYDKCEKKQSELMERSGKINELTHNNSDLQRTVDSLTEFIDLLKRFEPQKYAEIKQIQEYVQSQQKPEIQQEVRTNRKKMCGLE